MIQLVMMILTLQTQMADRCHKTEPSARLGYVYTVCGGKAVERTDGTRVQRFVDGVWK